MSHVAGLNKKLQNELSWHTYIIVYKCTVDAAYKTCGYKVQTLIRREIAWNRLSTEKNNLFITL